MQLKPASRTVLSASIAAIALGASNVASAAFIEDSKAAVELRNFYMNRDFRQSGATQSKAEEWAQGFILKMESGYTEGPVGFGLDAVGLLGVKLDSSPDRTGTGILQRDRNAPNRAQDDYGSAGVTAKAKLSATTLHVGTLQPILPVVMRNDSRLLPQTYRGAWLQSKEVSGLTLDLGKLDRVNQRDSSDNEEMTVFNGGRRNITFGSGGTTSDEFLFAGGRYDWSPQLATSYYYGGLDGIYDQHNFNLIHVLPLGDKQSFKTDLRFVRSSDDGGSNVDNDAFGALFTYRHGGHGFSGGYQHMRGDTGFAYVAGGDNALINLLQINDFGNEDERSWQVRYDYDFAAMGIPGLSLMTRYLSGDNVDRGAGASEGKTWERNTDIAYVIQSGPLKNLGLKLRNATTRSNFQSDMDENRVIVSYSLPLW
ncbi:OprD family porin [Pseudomonas stutzeri]|nr:OprD family porin [Stutzerimonas stutzeri]